MNFTTDVLTQANLDHVRSEALASISRFLKDPWLKNPVAEERAAPTDPALAGAALLWTATLATASACSAALSGVWFLVPVSFVTSMLISPLVLLGGAFISYVLVRILGSAISPRDFAKVLFHELPINAAFMASTVIIQGALSRVTAFGLIAQLAFMASTLAFGLLSTRRLLLRAGVSASIVKKTLIALVVIGALATLPGLMALRDALAYQHALDEHTQHIKALEKEMLERYR